MKLVAIARVRNELDIIEAFVRHHAQHFDKLIVLDGGSSDGTYQILLQLQSVYPDLVVLHQPTIGQKNRSMALLSRMVVDKFGADWIAPLDADEFIEPADGQRSENSSPRRSKDRPRCKVNGALLIAG